MQFIPEFVARKKGQQQVTYLHPLLEEVSRETYGILVYQEQVQEAANRLAGYTLGQADMLRRAMGKKDAEKMAQERARFVEGCQRVNGIPGSGRMRFSTCSRSLRNTGSTNRTRRPTGW